MSKISEQKLTSLTDVDVPSTLVKDDNNSNVGVLPYHTRLNPPTNIVFKSSKPSRVQESPLDARGPQEVLDYHGMYKDSSIYTKEPQKLFADLTAFNDYQTNLNELALAKSKFQSLPVEVRARFNQDVLQFAQYISQPDYDPELVMDAETVKAYRNYKKEQEKKAEYDKYIQSDEYKAQQKEIKLRAEYEKQQYESWKASHKKT